MPSSAPGEITGSQPAGTPLPFSAAADVSPQAKSGAFCISSVGFYPWPEQIPCLPGYHHGTWDEVIGRAQQAAGSGVQAPGEIIGAAGSAAGNAVDQQIAKALPWSGSLTNILNAVRNPTFWKSAGLLVAAGALVLIGLYLWFRSSPEARDAERAAGAV